MGKKIICSFDSEICYGIKGPVVEAAINQSVPRI